LIQLICDIDYSQAVIIYEDNQETIALEKNSQFHAQIKHIDIQTHFIKKKDRRIDRFSVFIHRSNDNVIDGYFDHYGYFDRATVDFSSTMAATARGTTSLIYYMMCLGARFYEYLAPSEIRNKLYSKLISVMLAS
jgi:hypothetical protein